MCKQFFFVLCCSLFATCICAQQKQSFNSGWQFLKNGDTAWSDKLLNDDGLPWQPVSLPHTANIEPIEKKSQQWQGVCFYRKAFTLPNEDAGKHVAILFEAAMHEADVYINGVHVYRHLGGYLPFYVDITRLTVFGMPNRIVVKLDNRDNPFIPPGKPLKDLDFNYYSGIYRNAWLVVKDKMYIPDAVSANRVAGGGVFVHYENITKQSATLVVKTAIKNDFTDARKAQVKLTLRDKLGKQIATITASAKTINANSDNVFEQTIPIAQPVAWSPDNPYLYQLTVEALENGKVIDKETIATGIRDIRIERDAFYLNGTKVKIRGTNRHQEYPYLGNALSDNAQYRDAYKIKLAGFNFVRLSHYPQSPAFLRACDELGIMVMDAIPGWQFSGNDSFRINSFQNIRDMIRRDRNHASIVLWEASLNESRMRKEYMEKAHAIVREELPYPGIYSAGWVNEVYDVYLPARQHGKAPEYWKKYDKGPLLVAEYGDWEYYAQNAGFNQTAYKDLKPEERSSRQLRGFGEKRLLQQALNYQESHNDNLYGNNLGDANWLIFDYNRGYAQDIESSGIMDMARLPKFSFYFYQSQVDAVVNSGSPFNKPVLFIANYWQAGSDTTIKVYSNCDEVELLLDGKPIAKRRPDNDPYSTNLKHPPFTFHVPAFRAGTLSAKGYIGNKQVIQEQRATPGDPAAIKLRVDYSGKPLQSGQNDIVFVYADVTDKNGNIVYNATTPIECKVAGDAEVVGDITRTAEAGTAAFLIKAGAKPGKVKVTATAAGLQSVDLVIDVK